MRKSHVYAPYFWIGLGAGAILLRLLLAGHPALVETYYSRGLFLGVRWVLDATLTWMPIPLLYLFVLILSVALIRQVRRWWRGPGSRNRKLGRALVHVLAWAGGLTFFFLLLWGFNYGRVPVEQQLGLDLKPVTTGELRKEMEAELKELIHWRAAIPGADTGALDEHDLPDALESKLRGGLEHVLDELAYPTVGRVRARKLYPKGIFLRFSSSGLYFPLTGEGHVDAGVHPLLRPFVMSHELAHGYGFADEGTCNFLAYLATTEAREPLIAYAGHLNYYRTLAGQYLRREPEEYVAFRKALPDGIRADLDAINANLAAYPDIMPRLRYYAYDTYLKAQGIPEGMLNYNRVVMLVRAWKNRLRI